MKYWTAFLCVLLLTSAAAEPLNLLTAYLEGDSSYSQNLQGSLSGGTSIIIKANGLGTDVSQYVVTVGDYPCEIPAEGLQSSFINCKTTATGSTSDIKNQLITVYHQFSSYEVPGKNFDYLAGTTPLIGYVYPLASPPSTLLRFFGNHRASDVGNGQRDFGDVLGLYIGPDQCNMQDIEQIYAGNTNSFDQILCVQSKTL